MASCLLSSLAPRNKQESHTVTMLFTQLLLNVGSLKVEHQHMLISYLHSNNLRELSHTHTHTLQSMLDKEPQSQSLSLWVQETAQWAREFSVSCKEGPPESGGQQGRRSPQSSRAEHSAADG